MSICTSAFRVPAEAMATAYGCPGFGFVTTAHPIASLSVADIRARARDLVPAVVKILGVAE